MMNPIISTPNKSVAKGNNRYEYVSVLVAFLTVFISCAAFMISCSRPVTTEVGDIPDYSHITSDNIRSLLCRLDVDPASMDTSSPGQISVPLTLFGFWPSHSTLYITDSTAPEVVSQNVCVTTGTDLTGDMFVRQIYDKTHVTVAILSPVSTDTRRITTVQLAATDEGGNTTWFESRLSVIDPGSPFVFEGGISPGQISYFLRLRLPQMGKPEFDQDATKICGDFIATGRNGDTAYFTKVSIVDTTPPTANVTSFDIALGDFLTAEQLVSNISDFSQVNVEFLSRPDFKHAGKYAIPIRLTDAYGNCSHYTSHILIHNISTDITAEITTSVDRLASMIFHDQAAANALSLKSDSSLILHELGSHTVFLFGLYNSIPVKITMIDTTAPIFSVTTGSYLVGTPLPPSYLVTSCVDATEVTYSFQTEPDFSREGTYDVTVIATDAAGNTSEQVTSITFFYDLTAPVISGHTDISFRAGVSYDYTQSVSAWDRVWGAVSVSVDHSSVDPNTPGSYPLIYIAVDGSGNAATETVTVTVTAPIRVCLAVENIMQMPALPNGCEVVSLAIALNYAGHPVDPVELYDSFMPKSPLKNGDPWTSYVGDAKGQGYGCYAPCIVTTGNAYLAAAGSSKTVSDVSGQSLSYYEHLIDCGIPVILWGTIGMNGDSRLCWEGTIDGKYVNWHSYSHCLVLIGYTDDTYIFCDPLEGVVEYAHSAVESSFAVNYRQACIVT